MRDKYVIQIQGLVNGEASPYDGTYLKRFDFDGCTAGECNLFTVKDAQDALAFEDVPAAAEMWKTVDPRQPLRSDGKPNRPLTVFSVTIEPLASPK